MRASASSAEEVENLVYRMPGIAQVAAVAAPDAELGERICVFVVPQPGPEAYLTLDAIRDGMTARPGSPGSSGRNS